MVNYGRQTEDGETAVVGINTDLLLVQTPQFNYAINHFWPGSVVHSCDPSIWEVQAGGPEVHGPASPSDHRKGRQQKALQARGPPGQTAQGFTVKHCFKDTIETRGRQNMEKTD